ncbi:MAG: Cof-type HAD-IIB family hydrolase [Erysipelotrichaceae bacterium]|jgi:Cof subfamily protein (haloacid dehalogenase superfamily)|nr:Cof-type HAD-IIB family hydrolase [Erysipelotrichaceae bacterium]
MEIKLIAMDMDGTLLDSQSRITTKTREALLEAQKQGIRLVLASGRNYLGLVESARELKMKEYGGFFLGVNGQQITNLKTGETQYIARISIPLAKKVLAYAVANDLEFFAVLNDTLYNYFSPQLKKKKLEYAKEHHLPQEHLTASVFSFVKKQNYEHIYYIEGKPEDIVVEANKLVFAQEPEILQKHIPALQRLFGSDLEMGRTSPRWLEFTPKGINKGSSLQAVMKQEKIKKEEVIAFGDGENDLAMLQAAGLGIAMSNAMEPLRQAADYITLSNDEDGIALALEKYLD